MVLTDSLVSLIIVFSCGMFLRVDLNSPVDSYSSIFCTYNSATFRGYLKHFSYFRHSDVRLTLHESLSNRLLSVHTKMPCRPILNIVLQIMDDIRQVIGIVTLPG
jgi:hypothetical protein